MDNRDAFIAADDDSIDFIRTGTKRKLEGEHNSTFNGVIIEEGKVCSSPENDIHILNVVLPEEYRYAVSSFTCIEQSEMAGESKFT